jgi:hypothetical protein
MVFCVTTVVSLGLAMSTGKVEIGVVSATVYPYLGSHGCGTCRTNQSIVFPIIEICQYLSKQSGQRKFG